MAFTPKHCVAGGTIAFSKGLKEKLVPQQQIYAFFRDPCHNAKGRMILIDVSKAFEGFELKLFLPERTPLRPGNRQQDGWAQRCFVLQSWFYLKQKKGMHRLTYCSKLSGIHITGALMLALKDMLDN